MSDLAAIAIPDVDTLGPVVHLAWVGPRAWLYSPTGWRIRRREAGRIAFRCHTLDDALLAELRAHHVIRFPLGRVRWRVGVVPQPFDGPPSAESAEVFTFDLAAPTDHVRVDVTGKHSWSFGLRRGKVVAATARLTGQVRHALDAPGLDRVVLLVQVPTRVGLCVGHSEGGGDWLPIAELQIPLREADPTLTSVAAERGAARARLLPGETVSDAELDELATFLRPALALGTRPGASSLWILDEQTEPVEMAAIEPLRTALVHPRWRRILGFAWSDRDPALVQGQAYEYEVSGDFPAADLADRVVGVHTVPATTALPASFALGDVRIALPRPTTVETLAPPADGVLTRRAIALSPDRESWWVTPGIDGWSAIVDLPAPATAVTLELGGGAHDLTWATVDDDDHLSPSAPVPASATPRLERPAPFVQLRLGGRGRLCAISLNDGPPALGLAPLATMTPPVVVGPTPPPAPPAWVAAASLQQPLAIADPGAEPVALRHDLGFEVTWMPAMNVNASPPELPPPPLEVAAFELEHRTTAPVVSDWERVVAEDYVLGNRGGVEPPPLVAGADLLAVFPEEDEPAPGLRPMRFLDAFDAAIGEDPPRRPAPPPGGLHQYRVRSVDVVGRPSATWTESTPVRLEKHDPPPAPAAVTARVLVAGDPGLSPDETARLGTLANLVLVRWGWHAEQRTRDALAREFRVYLRRDSFDHVPGTISGVTALGNGRYSVALVLEGAVETDVSRGLRFDGGYPFAIESHDGGDAGADLTAILIARVPDANGVYPEPHVGRVLFPLRLDPQRGRPPAWGARVAIVPITQEERYEVSFIEELDLSPDHPEDRLMIGVSAADAEPYVDDPLAPADVRPGNEGPIVAAIARGRWQGRPELVDAPALALVPSITAPQPRDRPIEATLDVRPLLDGTGLAETESLAFERAAADDVARAYRADAGRVLAVPPAPARPGETETEVAIANAGDRAALLAVLEKGGRLADQYAVFLAAMHPQRDRLFASVGTAAMRPDAVSDELPPRATRWLYRARRCDAAGNRSATAVVLRGVVRVPGLAPIPPARAAALAGDPVTRFRLRVEDRADLGDLVVFSIAADLRESVEGATLLRIPGREAASIRLRLPDGQVVAPTLAPTSGAAVTTGEGFRHVVVDVPAPGPTLRVWAACTTIDGVASALNGPWRVLGATP